MKRTFSLLAAAMLMSAAVASPSWAAGVQANSNTSASVQSGAANQDTGFFSRLGNNVRGWFSSDNDAAARADMATSPSTNAGGENTARIQADMEADARADANAANDANSTAPAAGTASTTRSNLDTGVNVGVGVGTGVGTELGGGTATGMGNVGAGADTNAGARIGTGAQTGSAGNQ